MAAAAVSDACYSNLLGSSEHMTVQRLRCASMSDFPPAAQKQPYVRLLLIYFIRHTLKHRSLEGFAVCTVTCGYQST